MMNDESRQEIQEVEHDFTEEASVTDAYFRKLFATMDDTSAAAGKIAKSCAELGITLAELLKLARSCGVELEAAALELLEKGEISAKTRRGPTGFEGKRPPMDTRPKYTPAVQANRKKKHGRESGRKL